MCAPRVMWKHVHSSTVLFFFNPHPRICLLILEKRNREEREREKEREREIQVSNIDLLPPVHALTRNGTRKPWCPTNWATWPRLAAWFLKAKVNIQHEMRSIVIPYRSESEWIRATQNSKGKTFKQYWLKEARHRRMCNLWFHLRPVKKQTLNHNVWGNIARW